MTCSGFCNTLKCIEISSSLAQQPNAGQGFLISDVSRSHKMTHHSRWDSPAAFTPGNDPVSTVQETGLAPGPVWTAAVNLAPHRDSVPGPSKPVASRYTNWATATHSHNLYLNEYPQGDQTKEVEMSGVCSMHANDASCIHNFWGTLDSVVRVRTRIRAG
jgi:hypothetical protein